MVLKINTVTSTGLEFNIESFKDYTHFKWLSSSGNIKSGFRLALPEEIPLKYRKEPVVINNYELY